MSVEKIDTKRGSRVRVHLGLNETKKVIVRDGWLGAEDWLLETKRENIIGKGWGFLENGRVIFLIVKKNRKKLTLLLEIDWEKV